MREAYLRIKDKRYFFTLFDKCRQVGFLKGEDKGKYFVVYDIKVPENFRGRGYGKQLIHHVVKWSRKPVMILFPYPWVMGFYKKLGFKKIPKGLATFKRLTKKEKALVRTLRKEYERYLRKNKDAVLFSKSTYVLFRSRR